MILSTRAFTADKFANEELLLSSVAASSHVTIESLTRHIFHAIYEIKVQGRDSGVLGTLSRVRADDSNHRWVFTYPHHDSSAAEKVYNNLLREFQGTDPIHHEYGKR